MNYYSNLNGWIVLDTVITIFFYLAVPLIITSIVFKKTNLVRYRQVIIINAVVIFIIFSVIAFFQGRASSNVFAAFLWPSIAFFIAKKIYGRNAKKCPHCHKLSNTDPCEFCGEDFKPTPQATEKKPANVILKFDKNGVDFEWISFEIFLDDLSWFVSHVKDTRLCLAVGAHDIYYKFHGSKIPVLKFDIPDMNEVITITCMLLDKNHISASITERSPRTE